MADLKHVGRTIKAKRKCIVAYRVIPNDPENCLVVYTESLDSDMHDSLINLVESNAGQNSYELAQAMARTQIPDGRNMLTAFHTTGKLNKIATAEVEMTPNGTTTVNLAELNQIIAEQRGVTVADLALQPDGSTPPEGEQNAEPASMEVVEEVETVEETVLTDEELAAQYRSQADAMFKEAKRLREQAEELVPTKRKKKEEAEA